MKKIKTWHIHIRGQVQGVGFRPFVYQVALKSGLAGWVNNTSDGLHIEFNANKILSGIFYDEVVNNSPRLSHITSHCIKEVSSVHYSDFRIIQSTSFHHPVLLISPDFATCDLCLAEMNDKNNWRYHYSFTTCTQCGPRYSIINQLPYDRDNTVMNRFKMCDKCLEEYNDPNNRRHFSQTNSCSDCPVVMQLFDNRQNLLQQDQSKIINKVCQLWSEGKIVAIKGIGGYLLTCDASNTNTISELRRRKHRPAKPFALMYPTIALLQKEALVNEPEAQALLSVAAPVVVLKLKDATQSEIALNEIAPHLSSIGVMLPYAPLYKLLLQKFNKPIVATSGNISSGSIVFDDKQAFEELGVMADYIVSHNRKIITPQDDSVITFSKQFQQRIMRRRARGFAPFYFNKNVVLPAVTIFAMGALLKSCFTLLQLQNIHVSQYLGNTDNYDTQKNFIYVLRQFMQLLRAQPQVVLIDAHPGYFTSKFGAELAEEGCAQLITIQHHEAHFASVLGEHNLTQIAAPILGVIWDGTGFGTDGQIWGGEFFIYHHRTFSRNQHFDYFNHFLGDKMAMEPRLSAFSICHEIEEATTILQTKFTTTEWANYNKLIVNNQLKTSSVGRIFDAVASLLGLIDKTSYEGEAAMLLEEQALLYFNGELNIPAMWLNIGKPAFLSSKGLMLQIIQKIKEGLDKSAIAAWFHVQLVLIIQQVAASTNCNKICFSGGVFQNGLLIDLLIKLMRDEHLLYFNQELSANDENISFGQLMWYTSTSVIDPKV